MAVAVKDVRYFDHEGVVAIVVGPFSATGSIPVMLRDADGRAPDGEIFFAAADVLNDAQAREGAIPVLIDQAVRCYSVENGGGLLVVFSPNDIRIRGTRIGIETVLWDYLNRGDAPEVIVARYPSLSQDQVRATIAYYEANRQEIAAYLAKWAQHADAMRAAQEQAPTPALQKLRRRAAHDASTAHAAR